MGGRACAARVAGAVLLALVCGACGPPERSPEHRIRILLEDVERAARDKDLGALRDVVSEAYADDAGRDKQTIDALLTAHVLRRGSLHVLVRERGIELDGATQARVHVIAGLARTPVLDLADLRLPEADVYVFDVEMTEEADGEWRVTSAAWRRARPDDLVLWDPARGRTRASHLRSGLRPSLRAPPSAVLAGLEPPSPQLFGDGTARPTSRNVGVGTVPPRTVVAVSEASTAPPARQGAVSTGGRSRPPPRGTRNRWDPAAAAGSPKTQSMRSRIVEIPMPAPMHCVASP